jgi:ribosome-associated translation inhibitor RaiA
LRVFRRLPLVLEIVPELEFATVCGNCYPEIAGESAECAADCIPLRILPRKGHPMKVAIRHGNEEWREPIEKETEQQVLKLKKLLKRYDPDLVQLHGNIEKQPRMESYSFILNLSLPTGTLHATGEGDDVRSSVKAAFAEIETQIKKHMALLRKDYEWKRKRPRAKALA